MADEIDLTTGEGDRAEGAEKRRARSGGSGRSGRSSGRTASSKTEDNSLTSRLVAAFERIADTLDARGDGELAEAFRDDKEKLAGGFVSLTRAVTFLRAPLLVLVNAIELLLAFGRIGGILLSRLLDWRNRRLESVREAQEAWDAEHPTQPTAVQ